MRKTQYGLLGFIILVAILGIIQSVTSNTLADQEYVVGGEVFSVTTPLLIDLTIITTILAMAVAVIILAKPK